MKQQKQWLGTVIAGFTALVILIPNAWAGVVPLENRLPAWEDYGSKRIDFTNIDIAYKNGRTKKGRTEDTSFFGESNTNSTFSLFSRTDGYVDVPFNGEFIIDANISSRGVLRDGSSFGFYSNDVSIFGTGNEVDYACNKQGKNCSNGTLVFGGNLAAFGWSGSLGILEFVTKDLAGWAMDMWQPGEDGTRMEHIYLDVGVFDLDDVSSVKTFNAVANGFAVVPVPAAVWLFGSGLLGLIGIARRKRA